MVDRVVGQLSLADGLARSPETISDQVDRRLDWGPVEALLGPRSRAGPGNTSYPAGVVLRRLRAFSLAAHRALCFLVACAYNLRCSVAVLFPSGAPA